MITHRVLMHDVKVGEWCVMRETIISGAFFLDYKFTTMCGIFQLSTAERKVFFSATQCNKSDGNPFPATS
jgi:hypothetical protein